jgi:carotenoid cleavage dioxygenase-like enzyme
MLHKVNFTNGKAYYSNQYVKTKKYQTEKENKRALAYGIKHILDPVAMIHIFFRKLFGKRTLKTDDGMSEINTSNTALLYYDNKFLSLMEACRPIEVNVSTLETVKKTNKKRKENIILKGNII